MLTRLCTQASLALPRQKLGGRLVHSGPRNLSMAIEQLVPRPKFKSQGVTVTPEVSLTDDESLRISVAGFDSRELVTLHSSIRENDKTFAAVGHYVTDENGNVDTTEDASRGGNYVGVEPLGLIWGMEQAPGQRSGLRLMKEDVTKPFEIDLTVHRGHLGLKDIYTESNFIPTSATSFKRKYMADGVERIPVHYGKVRGMLFLPESGRGQFPGVIDMFGSVGGIVDMRAALLASRGFATLALPYFNYQDLPKDHQKLQMDYFEEATEFLHSHPNVIKNGLGVIGTSKGCDLALAMAEFLPVVRAVVAINGVCYSLDAELKYKGKVVKRAERGDRRKIIFYDDETIAIHKGVPVEVEEENMLHIEKSDASFLFVTSLDDQCVAPEASSVAPNRLRRFGKNNFEHLQLANTGHLVEPPFNPHFFYTFHKFSFGGTLLRWGGERAAHAQGQVHAWQKMLTFLREKLV